jgi:hypothetical protein
MSFENKNLRCRNCRFWWPTADVDGQEPVRARAIIGVCRRHAPPALVGDLPDRARHYPAWASTKRDDWCGEHQHLEM